MSITSLSDYKKPLNRLKDSGEIDVFEAARYFSGYNENQAYITIGGAKVINKEEKRGYYREGRASLDVSSLKHYYLHQNNQQIAEAQPLQQPQKTKEKKKQKQPSSPGGKIAQFLNSLFSSQTSSKKKKALKSLSATQSMKDEDESPIGRRKRRSSISHFRSTSSAIDTRSMYSSSSSGFRTPPPYNLNTPKSYKDLRSFDDYRDVLATLSKYKIQENGNCNVNGSCKDEKFKGSNNLDWIDEKLRLRNGLSEKPKTLNHSFHQDKKDKKKVNKHDEYDDGAESDSSSDLFELQIDYGFGFCSSGLPVYETTHMDNIKRSSATSITNGPTPIKA